MADAWLVLFRILFRKQKWHEILGKLAWSLVRILIELCQFLSYWRFLCLVADLINQLCDINY